MRGGTPSDIRYPISDNPYRAGNGTRTRDPNLGKVVLYQLSYSRESHGNAGPLLKSNRYGLYTDASICNASRSSRPEPDGGEGNRTPDLLNAIQALSQLSYAPGALWKRQTNVPIRNREG